MTTTIEGRTGWGSRARGVLAGAVYCAGLGVVSAAELGLVLVGQARGAARLAGRWQRLLGAAGARPVRALPLAGEALVGLALGVLSLVPLWMEALFVARSVLYGLVDRGPYDHSWGGPTRAGAWFVHFLVGIPFALAGFAALFGIARLHRRWTARMAGERGGAWVVPVVLLACAAGLVLFRAWLNQA